MKKWLNKFVRRLCELNIIISKTTLAGMDFMEDLENMNKNFRNKIQK